MDYWCCGTRILVFTGPMCGGIYLGACMGSSFIIARGAWAILCSFALDLPCFLVFKSGT